MPLLAALILAKLGCIQFGRPNQHTDHVYLIMYSFSRLIGLATGSNRVRSIGRTLRTERRPRCPGAVTSSLNGAPYAEIARTHARIDTQAHG